VFVGDRFSEQTDDDDDREHDAEENQSEVQVVDVLDDRRTRIVGLRAARQTDSQMKRVTPTTSPTIRPQNAP